MNNRHQSYDGTVCSWTLISEFSLLVMRRDVQSHSLVHQTEFKCVNWKQELREGERTGSWGGGVASGILVAAEGRSAAAAGCLAGSCRSALSGGVRMEVLIKSLPQLQPSPPPPPPAPPPPPRSHAAKCMPGQSRCHPAGVC